jgi:hypothetical protein
MPTELLGTLANELPALVLFSIVIFAMLRAFLQHLKEQSAISQAFIKEQREENNDATRALAESNATAVKDLTKVQNEALTHMSDSLCAEVSRVVASLHALTILNVGHDAFVRTSFRERLGAQAADRAQREAEAAEVAAVRK